MAKKTKVGIIGCGNMGCAIVKRISPKYPLFIFDKDSAKTKNIEKAKVAKSASDLIGGVSVVILAVKPQDFKGVLAEIKNNIDDKLIVSIAAGIPTKFIEKVIGKARVIRVMPNLPAKIGKGMSCLCKGKFAMPNDLKFAKKIFDLLGETLILKENMMNAATAVSGSGPGFLYSLIIGKTLEEAKKYAQASFMPVLIDCASSLSFNQSQAKILAEKTTLGSIKFLEESKLSADDLVKQVASKGGTTEAGLKELEGNLKFLPKAVKAALKRARKLSRK